MFAWPKNAVEIMREIDDEFNMEWDTDSNIAILLQFIEEYCDPEAFKVFIRDCASREAETLANAE